MRIVLPGRLKCQEPFLDCSFPCLCWYLCSSFSFFPSQLSNARAFAVEIPARPFFTLPVEHLPVFLESVPPRCAGRLLGNRAPFSAPSLILVPHSSFRKSMALAGQNCRRLDGGIPDEPLGRQPLLVWVCRPLPPLSSSVTFGA